MNTDQTNDTRYRAAYLGALLARHYPDATPHMIGRVVYDMQAAARAAVAWETKRCNVPMTEAQEDAGARRIAKLEDRVNASLADLAGIDRARINHLSKLRQPGPVDLGPYDNDQAQDDLFAELRRLEDRLETAARVSLGGDPRGPCARLMVPGERGDGFGEGFAIY